MKFDFTVSMENQQKNKMWHANNIPDDEICDFLAKYDQTRDFERADFEQLSSKRRPFCFLEKAFAEYQHLFLIKPCTVYLTCRNYIHSTALLYAMLGGGVQLSDNPVFLHNMRRKGLSTFCAAAAVGYCEQVIANSHLRRLCGKSNRIERRVHHILLVCSSLREQRKMADYVDEFMTLSQFKLLARNRRRVWFAFGALEFRVSATVGFVGQVGEPKADMIFYDSCCTGNDDLQTLRQLVYSQGTRAVAFERNPALIVSLLTKPLSDTQTSVRLHTFPDAEAMMMCVPLDSIVAELAGEDVLVVKR